MWGNKTSVLVGDFLFSRAFQLMAKYGDIGTLKILSDTSVVIAEGEVLELSNDRDPTINEDLYFKVINAKTASLFSAACQVGGISAKATNKEIESLKSFGTNFGMAFQLIDDAIDYASDKNSLGKNIGDDFKEGKITLPVILAYIRSNKKEKEFWKRTIEKGDQNEDDWDKAFLLMQKHDAVSDTRKEAEIWVNKAKYALRGLPNSEVTLLLSDLADYVLTRSK